MMLLWMNFNSCWPRHVSTQTHMYWFSYPLVSTSSSSIHVKICVARIDDTSNSWMSWVEAMTKQLRFAWGTERGRNWGKRRRGWQRWSEKLCFVYGQNLKMLESPWEWDKDFFQLYFAHGHEAIHCFTFNDNLRCTFLWKISSSMLKNLQH